MLVRSKGASPLAAPLTGSMTVLKTGFLERVNKYKADGYDDPLSLESFFLDLTKCLDLLADRLEESRRRAPSR
jgi:hypothetical protein